MFVKWSIRPKRRSPGLGDLLVARLVESWRPEPGQTPRQRQIAHLGSVRTSMPTNHRIMFWESVLLNLDRIALPPEVRAAIEANIEAKVPRATRADWRQG